MQGSHDRGLKVFEKPDHILAVRRTLQLELVLEQDKFPLKPVHNCCGSLNCFAIRRVNHDGPLVLNELAGITVQTDEEF